MNFFNTNGFTLNLILSLLIVYKVYFLDAHQLGDYITDFSPQAYDLVQVHQRHVISKRSIYDKVINVPLHFHSKRLDLTLYPADEGVFHSQTKLTVDGEAAMFDRSHLYNGVVKGDSGSHVSGSIIGGVFQGVITTSSGDVYHVERKAYHAPHPLTERDEVHSVLYREADVDMDKFHQMRAKRGAKKDRYNHFCGFDEEEKRKMFALEDSGLLYQPPFVREKRATTPDKNTCTLFMQTDPEFWDHIKATLGTSDETMIRQEISAFVAFLVNEVNGIYKTQEFGGNIGYEFRVDRLAINQTCRTTDDHWFCEKSIDVANFLNLNTYTDHDEYCLAYILTYRDFADGTLGLAWVAKPGSLLGGICSKYKPYSESGSKRLKSLNTGVVTVKNYGERVPKLMSKLTLAHEIGHNFGSQHDESGNSLDCTPFTDNQDERGNYIMYYAAITGKRSNNLLFSPCSIQNMSLVLGDSTNTACLIKNTDGFCGNGIKEGTEQCDCGFVGDCSTCCGCCVGRNKTNAGNPKICTLETGKLCDPSQGPCCSANCNYHNSTVCSPATECALPASCDGTGYHCPAAVPLSNFTECNRKTQICMNGECTGSICSKIRGGLWEECSQSSGDTGVNANSLCTVSCKDPSTGTCHSSYDPGSVPADFKDMLQTVNSGETITLKPGSPCDQDLGFCDYFDVCRQIDDLGPLARLKKLLLSLTSLENLVEWLKVYWWAVLLSVAGLVAFMTLLVKFGAVFTPSSNPDKSEARKLSKPLTKPKDSRRKAEGPSVGYRQSDGRVQMNYAQ